MLTNVFVCTPEECIFRPIARIIENALKDFGVHEIDFPDQFDVPTYSLHEKPWLESPLHENPWGGLYFDDVLLMPRGMPLPREISHGSRFSYFLHTYANDNSILVLDDGWEHSESCNEVYRTAKDLKWRILYVRDLLQNREKTVTPSRFYVSCPINFLNIREYLNKISVARAQLEAEGLRADEDNWHTYQTYLRHMDPQQVSMEEARQFLLGEGAATTVSWDSGPSPSSCHPRPSADTWRKMAGLAEHREEYRLLYACSGGRDDERCLDECWVADKCHIPVRHEAEPGNRLRARTTATGTHVLVVTPFQDSPLDADIPEEEADWTFARVVDEIDAFRTKSELLWEELVAEPLRKLHLKPENAEVLPTAERSLGFLERVLPLDRRPQWYLERWLHEHAPDRQLLKDTVLRGMHRREFAEYFQHYGDCVAYYCLGWQNDRRAVYDHEKLAKAGVPAIYEQ